MADVRAFRSVRYNPARFGRDLTDLVCPPYDVISPAEQAALYARHAANFVRLELTREDGQTDKYARAGADYRGWLRDSTLVQEQTPALYAYLQQFSLNGVSQERRGIVAALRLEPWERRVVRPHERTLSGPKQDRLELMRACRANFSPIWGLYRDPGDATARLWDAALRREPDAEAHDADGVQHRVWVLDDFAENRELGLSLAEVPIYIADGHHRYETAMHYQAEVHASQGPPGEDNAANFVLAYLVESSDPGLIVLGTHRFLAAPRPLTREELLATLGRWFVVEDGPSDMAALLAAVEDVTEGAAFGVWAPGLNVSVVARRRDSVPAELAAGRSAAWRQLDLAALHALAIDQLFPEGTSALSESGRLRYARTLAEVEEALQANTADLAFLVRRTPVTQVMAVADAGDLMPEKSTYFCPKPVSGLVVAPLEGDVPHTS